MGLEFLLAFLWGALCFATLVDYRLGLMNWRIGFALSVLAGAMTFAMALKWFH